MFRIPNLLIHSDIQVLSGLGFWSWTGANDPAAAQWWIALLPGNLLSEPAILDRVSLVFSGHPFMAVLRGLAVCMTPLHIVDEFVKQDRARLHIIDGVEAIIKENAVPWQEDCVDGAWATAEPLFKGCVRNEADCWRNVVNVRRC